MSDREYAEKWARDFATEEICRKNGCLPHEAQGAIRYMTAVATEVFLAGVEWADKQERL